MLNVGAATTVGIVTSSRENIIDMNLKLPVCADSGQRIAISRRVGTRWRLIGYGILK
jgi:translation initiation factor 2 subunit 3